MPVDVSAYANWAGAYTTEGASHITISSLNADNQGTAAFEMLFHEVLHTMDSTLFEQYRTAARAQGKRMLRNPTHPFVFYTAGEVTRRLFPGHVPYAESVGLWARSRDMGPMLPLLRRHWQPWLDGTVSLGAASHSDGSLTTSASASARTRVSNRMDEDYYLSSRRPGRMPSC